MPTPPRLSLRRTHSRGPSLARAWLLARRLVLGLALLVLLFITLAAIIPLILPIPALEGTRSARELAAEVGTLDDVGQREGEGEGKSARFVEVEGLSIYVDERPASASSRAPLLLVHGFLASTFTWREVLDPLAERRRVIAFDRPAFGLSARPLAQADDPRGRSPYSAPAQVVQTIALMDTLGVEQAVLIGSSSGASLAMRIALAHPERVRALILIGPALAGDVPPWLRMLLNTPQLDRLGPLLARGVRERIDGWLELAWHDPSRLDEAIRKGHRRGLTVHGWDRALWQYTLAHRGADDLLLRLGELQTPTLVLTGDDDRVVDPKESEALADGLADAELIVLGECGHLPQEERPAATLAAIEGFLRHLERSETVAPERNPR